MPARALLSPSSPFSPSTSPDSDDVNPFDEDDQNPIYANSFYSASSTSLMLPPAIVLTKDNPTPFDVELTAALRRERDAAEADVDGLKGVSEMKGMYQVFKENKNLLWALYFSLFFVKCAYILDNCTTATYLPFATSSYKEHAQLLALINIVSNITTAVCRPFIAKISDALSRRTAFIITGIIYVVGYLLVVFVHRVEGLAAGRVLATIGQSGLDFLTDLFIADLTPLQSRGLISAIGTFPNIPLALVGANIAGWFIDRDLWRWGYGIFIVIIPVGMVPLMVLLSVAEGKANENAKAAKSISSGHHNARSQPKPFGQVLSEFAVELDMLGLVLLGVAFGLILIPFSLAANAKDGWLTPSLLAMWIIGTVTLVAFLIWEYGYCTRPAVPLRILKNRTFLLAMGIDCVDFLGASLKGLYYTSYIYIVKNWSVTQLGYFTQIMTLGLCGGGLVVGLIIRLTHRYKSMQIFGLSIKIVAAVLTLYARGSHATSGALVMSQLLTSIGGACTVIATGVCTQACVPHQDLATVMALLYLFTELGSAVGITAAGNVWTSNMKRHIKEELPYPENKDPTLITELYNSISKVRKLYPDLNSPVRQAIIRAYDRTVMPLFAIPILLAFITLSFGIQMPNFYLGKQQNAADAIASGNEEEEEADEGTPLLSGERSKLPLWRRVLGIRY